MKVSLKKVGPPPTLHHSAKTHPLNTLRCEVGWACGGVAPKGSVCMRAVELLRLASARRYFTFR